MTDWFRSWHGAPTDPKWLGIARRAGVAPGIAVAVAWALMDRASQAEDRGSIAGYDPDGLAYFFGCEPEQVDAIVSAMTDKGMIADGRFTSWEKRQPKREDDSSKRVREHRERTRQQSKRDVTQRNAPDTDTDTETDTEAEAEAEAETDSSSLRSDEERAAPKRAVRLSPDWSLPVEWRQDARDLGLSEAEIDREAATMLDWSLSAKDGARKDWRAMWRNWCRRKVGERPKSRASPQAKSGGVQGVFRQLREHMQDGQQDQGDDGAGAPLLSLPHVGTG